MPIRVTCQCGKSFAVPDALAGKAGKCPNCQQIIRVPSSGNAPAQAKAPSAATTAPAAARPAAKPAAVPDPSGLGSLFDSAGLTQKQGNFCPACDALLPTGAVICVKCGLNLADGTKVEGHQLETKRVFGNKQLNHAAEMMTREAQTEKRLLNSGMPWWMMVAGLVAVAVFIAGALIWMDAKTTGEVSKNALMARIQSAGILDVMLASLGFGLYLVATFASFAILFTAFFESVAQGLLVMFVPFYIFYYMFSRLFSQRLVSTVIIFFVTSILSGICLGISLPRI